MTVAFWTASVKVGHPVEVQPPEGYYLSLQQAAISGNVVDAIILKVSTISFNGDEVEAVVGTLRPIRSDQINLNLVFGYDVPVMFSVSGDSDGEVHLNGYYQPCPGNPSYFIYFITNDLDP